ncbi:MAG TPA: hypothetical protein HPP94_05865 [Desulfuromonadales bacterium]|nr:hypothetical protein [Desulfuromonadales bacterium]
MKIIMLQKTALAAVLIMSISGCVSTGGSAIETHNKGLSGLTENDYVPAKKPIDRHFIGAAWSKQFGPVEEAGADEIRVKKDRSFSNVQQDYAYNLGLALGATPTALPLKGEFGIQGGSIEKAKLAGLEIISPVTFADIPFELDVPYVTEALRLANFKISDEKNNKASINVGASHAVGTATSVAEAGSQARRGTEGDGLVVAYKLQKINRSTYERKDSGALPFGLEKLLEVPSDGLLIKARLLTIEPGSGKSLPRSILWACQKADAQSRNMVAAWIVDIKSTDPKRKSLTIGFPALPRIDDCQGFSRVIYSRIDARTDRVIRQKVNMTLVDADVTDFLQPKVFDARVTLIDESFGVTNVTSGDL